jgi:O-antigen/teichoic acid export membrane protein
MAPVGVVLVAAAPLVLNLFFGEPYVDHLDILLIYILLKVVFIGLSPLNPFFFAVGYAKYNTIIALVKNILYSIILYLACLHLGLYGILVAYVAQVGFNFGVKTVILKRKRGEWQSA